MTGIQGMGVNTPEAAAVADATVGFAKDEHMPKGIIFTIGLLSKMLASGVPVNTRLMGKTTKELGAAPKLHLRLAPEHTCRAIISPFTHQDTLTWIM